MNRRTQLLLLAAGLVFGLYGADRLYRTQIEEPTQRLSADLVRLGQQRNDLDSQYKAAQKAVQRLDSYQQRALPYEPQLARAAYQDWLLRLVSEHQLRSASVDAALPRRIEIRSRTERRQRVLVGHSITYSLRGQGTLAQWSDLLSEFQNAAQLHKITSVAFNPLGAGGELDGNLTIEVLSLNGSTRKDSLSTWQLAKDRRPPASVQTELVSRNLFARGFAKALMDVQLKAITTDRNGQSQVWFSIDASGQTEVLNARQRLPLALHDIEVTEIHQDHALIQVNRQPIKISLGQSVAEALSRVSNAGESGSANGALRERS
ncbi:MAG: hypothetical protein KF752_13945 [Pirellulaceae bacterium]|nr:hypothetical protein [Pirellulaceae bacterium]